MTTIDSGFRKADGSIDSESAMAVGRDARTDALRDGIVTLWRQGRRILRLGAGMVHNRRVRGRSAAALRGHVA